MTRSFADRLTDWAATHTLQNQRSLVVDRPRARRLMWAAFAQIALGISALFASQLIPAGDGGVDTLLHSLCLVVVGVLIGLGCFGGIARAIVYRSGWLDGRRQMMISLEDARRSGVSPHDWLETQIAKDLFVMGLLDDDDDDEL